MCEVQSVSIYNSCVRGKIYKYIYLGNRFCYIYIYIYFYNYLLNPESPEPITATFGRSTTAFPVSLIHTSAVINI